MENNEFKDYVYKTLHPKTCILYVYICIRNCMCMYVFVESRREGSNISYLTLIDGVFHEL